MSHNIKKHRHDRAPWRRDKNWTRYRCISHNVRGCIAPKYTTAQSLRPSGTLTHAEARGTDSGLSLQVPQSHNRMERIACTFEWTAEQKYSVEFERLAQSTNNRDWTNTEHNRVFIGDPAMQVRSRMSSTVYMVLWGFFGRWVWSFCCPMKIFICAKFKITSTSKYLRKYGFL